MAHAATKGAIRTSRSERIQAQLWGISVLTRRVEAVRVVEPEVIELEVFYDYFCPFVYRASVLLQNVGRTRPLKVAWRYFSLAQVNSKDDGWTGSSGRRRWCFTTARRPTCGWRRRPKDQTRSGCSTTW